MSDTTKPMTPGQMRQIIALATSTVPADLSYEEAARILRAGKPLRDMLESVWNTTRVPEQVYSVKVPAGEIMQLLKREFPECNHYWDKVEELIPSFVFTGKRGRRVDLVVRTYPKCSMVHARTLLARDGYRSADIREMLAFVQQHRSVADSRHNILPLNTDAYAYNVGALGYLNPDLPGTDATEQTLVCCWSNPDDGSWDQHVLSVKL